MRSLSMESSCAITSLGPLIIMLGIPSHKPTVCSSIPLFPPWGHMPVACGKEKGCCQMVSGP